MSCPRNKLGLFYINSPKYVKNLVYTKIFLIFAETNNKTMFYFIAAPEITCLIGIAIIGFIILNVMRSILSAAGNMTEGVKPEDIDKVLKDMGPMTWKEKLVTILAIVIFVALISWIAIIT